MSESGARPPAIRASDAEREAVVARLQTAAGEGRLALDELAGRLDRALGAVTRSELEVLTADLPEQAAPAPPATKARRWIVGIMGGGDLDLTGAVVEGPETEIQVFSLMGGSKIVVPDGVHVDLGGFAFMGGNSLRLEGAPTPPPGAPVVRVRAYSIMGGTDVRRAKRR